MAIPSRASSASLKRSSSNVQESSVVLSAQQTENIIIGRLIELIFCEDFKLALGADAEHFTKAKLPENIKVQNMSVKNTRVGYQIYRRYIRSFPMFSELGETFLTELDTHFDRFVMKTGVNLLMALKQDILSATKYYVSYAGAIKEEEYHGCQSTGRDLLMWRRVLTVRRNKIDTFSLYAPVAASSPADPVRIAKATRSSDNFRRVIKALKVGEKDVKNMQKTPQDFVWWNLIEKFPNVAALPPVHREVVDSIVYLFAHFFDNVLDDPVKRQNMRAIFDKLPISIMVMSVKVMNPAPFVDKVIKLFLWSPSKNIPSLVQFIAGIICKQSTSQATLKKMGKYISPEFKKLAERLSHKDLGLFSSFTDDQLKEVVKKAGYENPELPDIVYLRTCLRAREKDVFVAGLAEEDQKKFIMHACKGIPQLIREMSKFCDVSKVLKQFFDSLGETLDALKVYDSVQKQADGTWSRDYLPVKEHASVIDAIAKAWYKMVDLFYPYLQKLGTLRGTKKEPTMWLGMVDFIFMHLFSISPKGYSNPFTKCLGPCVHVHDIITSLSESEQKKLESEAQLIMGLSDRGTHEALWPKMPIIEEKLYPQFAKYLENHCKCE